MTTTRHRPAQHPLLLLPGHWLGAWAWDEVVARLTDLGHRVEAITLPGLESTRVPRAAVTLADHVSCVVESARTFDGPVVLVAHSGAGAVATAVADQVPSLLARIIYVESGPVAHATVPRPALTVEDTELPFPGLAALVAQGASAEGLTDHDRAELTARAVPHPAGALREPVMLSDPRRHSVPVTLVCCSLPGAAVLELAAAGEPMFAPLNDLDDLTVVDLPTGHWPMLSRSTDLADLIAVEADRD